MKIVFLEPGSGGNFYCQNCLRDAALVKALRELGHDVIVIPLYLPLYDLGDSQPDAPLFHGAISLYLKHRFPFLNRLPNWLSSLFDSKLLLKYAACRAGTVRAGAMDELTIDMLRGEYPAFIKETERLTDWLKKEFEPDLIHLSNGLLTGIAPSLKITLNCPVVCALQDEHQWIDAMEKEAQQKIYSLINKQSQYVDRFVPVSQWYAEQMQGKSQLPDEKVTVIYPGISTDCFVAEEKSESLTIGYYSRMTESLGLELLVEAFIKLKALPRFAELRLKVAGGFTSDDKPFVKRIKQRLMDEKFSNQATFEGNLTGLERRAFFSSLTLLSVPVEQGEAFGIFQLEAMAARTPVVQPRVGAFSEVIEHTGGGLTFSPCTVDQLVESLVSLLDHPEEIEKLSAMGYQSVINNYTAHNSALHHLELFRTLL